MNCNRYRVVFNKVRGQLMAVAETANGHGKGSHGERAATAPATPGCLADYKPVVLALWLAVGALPSAWAQIIADPNAPAGQRPTVLLDSTGRPLINVRTPSTAGVSRNTYKQFDVQSNGIVFNNQRASNPWLATGEAKVILNEINSSNPSYLKGAITVNGATAQVVIANPSGLKIDGASFINASRATLTTGSPVISNGQLTGLNVKQGTVDITGKGLGAVGTSYTDILTRAASIAGRVDANEITITTGTQTVDYVTGQLTALAGTGTKPVIAIDTAALGGMYAGKITLLATEAGVGVRNAGTLQANATTGQLIITADGRLENSGRMDGAVTSAATISGNIDNRGTLLGRNLLIISAGTDFNQSGVGVNQGVTTASTVLVNAQRDVNLAANALISSNGIGGQVAISAGNNINLAAGSSVSAHGDVQLSSDGQIIATSAAVRSTTIDATAVAA